MSDTKERRTRQQIDQEYQTLATVYGDRAFKIQHLKNALQPLETEIAAIFGRMAQINQEVARDYPELIQPLLGQENKQAVAEATS